MAFRFLLRVLGRDAAGLEGLVAPDLFTVFPELGRRLPRARVIGQLLRAHSRLPVSSQTRLDELVAIAESRAETLADYVGANEIPEGLAGSDVIVTFDLRPLGLNYFRERSLGWQERGGVIVRLGAEAPIVGL